MCLFLSFILVSFWSNRSEKMLSHTIILIFLNLKNNTGLITFKLYNNQEKKKRDHFDKQTK